MVGRGGTHAQKQTMLQILSLVLAESSLSDDLANSNLFFMGIEFMLNAIILIMYQKFKMKEWLAISLIGISCMATAAAKILISDSSFSLTLVEILKSICPFVAIALWVLSAFYFRYSINKSISDIPKLINDAIIDYHDNVHNPYKKNMISLDLSLPAGPRNPSNITIHDIFNDLSELKPSARRERGGAYLGNYIIWTCKVSHIEWDDENISLTVHFYLRPEMESYKPPKKVGKFSLEVPRFLLNGIFAEVIIPVANYPKIKLMNNGFDIIVDARIRQLCVEPMKVILDNAIITIKEMPQDDPKATQTPT